MTVKTWHLINDSLSSFSRLFSLVLPRLAEGESIGVSRHGAGGGRVNMPAHAGPNSTALALEFGCKYTYNKDDVSPSSFSSILSSDSHVRGVTELLPFPLFPPPLLPLSGDVFDDSRCTG